MGTFINSINNLITLPTTFSQNRQNDFVKQSIQNSIIDTVNFSDQAQKLFDIGSIDNQFNGIFGLPNTLTPTQQDELKNIQNSLDTLLTTSNSNFQTLDFDKIYNTLLDTIISKQNLSQTDQDDIKKLSNELKNYMAQLSLSQLTGKQDDTLSQFTQGFSTIFPSQISDNQSQNFSTLSLQLNRLLFDGNNTQTSSLLDQFNTLYGLKTPSQDELNQAFNLFTQRNTLLSSLLNNTNFNTTYANLL